MGASPGTPGRVGPDGSGWGAKDIMAIYPELEIGIHGSDTGDYAVDLRFRRATDDQPPRRGKAQIDFEALDEAGDDYGRELTRQVFAQPELVAYFRDAFLAAQAEDLPLRVRLFIDTAAARLFGLKWELLEAPADEESPPGRPLSVHQQILFSRYLSSFDWRPVQLRPKDALRALIAVANPANLAEYRMAAIDADAEIELARRHLGEIPSEVVRGADTLNQVVARLLREEFDVLYVVCHGALIKGEPRLYLEGPDGRVAATAGGEVVARLAELPDRPRLIVLASCQSAGAADDAPLGDERALAAVGPKLAAAGLPAVLAMQARISMETAARFMPAFFEELARHGQVDRAASVARGMVRDRPDFWVPVVITRIGNGRIWYVPGFGTGKDDDIGWNALFKHIEDNLKEDSLARGKIGCTPILGSGLLEKLVGPPREVARRWADEVSFAMAPQDREDLPQVTQYLSVMEGLTFPAKALEDRYRIELARRFGAAATDPDAPLDDLLAAARRTRPVEPHAVLARLPFPVYITTNADDQLRRALVEAGKDPQAELCRWHNRPDYDWPPSAFGVEGISTYTPSLGRPLVYHLYGQLQEPDTLVLTEDDYFDYLIGLTRSGNPVPTVVKQAMTFSALLFLGFRIEEWDFRVLFRSILAQGERGELSKRFTHIAAQIDPEEGRHIDPEKARRYLQKYFLTARISIFWGSLDDFIGELARRCPPRLLAAPREAHR
jgi:hypothetical protein